MKAESVRTSKSRSRVFKLVVGVVSPIVFLLLLECGVRAFGVSPKGERFGFDGLLPRTAKATEQFQLHPTRFFTLAQNHRSTPHHLGRYAIGSYPFRGRPSSSQSRIPSIKRVAVIGDSCVYGVGVDVGDSLPEQIQSHLARMGRNEECVEVLNFGVPGYSCVQIARMVEEVLESESPDAVVLYPAAWNDQAPAHGQNDLVRRDQLNHSLSWMRHSALYTALTNLSRKVRSQEETSTEDIVKAWADGKPLYGYRVPEESLPSILEEAIRRCLDAKVEILVIVPPHPASTLEDYPRTGRDAKAVRQVSERLGVDTIDGESLCPKEDSRSLFVDYVHPSPKAMSILASEVAHRLLKTLLSEEPSPSEKGFSIVSVSPKEVPSLGDSEVLVTLKGDVGDGLVQAITIAGAPLLDLSSLGGGEYRGITMSNRAGPATLVVQTKNSVVALQSALTIRAPRLEIIGDPPSEIRFHSRPGDRATLVAARTLAPVPMFNHEGAFFLNEDDLIKLRMDPIFADESGYGDLKIDGSTWKGTGTLYMQASVVPNDEDPETTLARRWSELLTIELD